MKSRVTSRERGIYKVTLQGSVVNVLLTLFKLAAGIFGRSSAMIADAVHSLSDLITDLIVLVFVRISSKPEDDNHDYGHGKYETLATLLISVFLFIVGVGIFCNGSIDIYRSLVLKDVLPSPKLIAFVAAVVSIIAKELLFRYTYAEGKRMNSQAVMANAWHHRSDALSSVGAAVGIGGAILLGHSWSILDPLVAVLMSFWIIYEGFKLLKSSLNELLERSLPPETAKEIIAIIESVEPIKGFDELRTRRIGNYYAISFLIYIDQNTTVKVAHQYTDELEDRLRKSFGQNTYISIHIEPFLEHDKNINHRS